MNGIPKYEFGIRYKFKDFSVALNEIIKAVELYNNKRPHWSLDVKSPNEVYYSQFMANMKNLVS